MKIGVLTYHCPPNFGAQLQAISTIGFLKRMGHEPVIINWYAKDLEEMYSHRIPKIQVCCHEEFTRNVFPLSRKCQTEDELINEINSLCLDGIVAGSDALFKYTPLKIRRHFSKRRLKYVYNTALSCELIDGNPFFGGFLERLDRKTPAVVYAVSSQNCPFLMMNSSEKQKMKRALMHYRIITTRDSWTKQMVETVMKRNNISVFPDPVFSFNRNNYIPLPPKEILVRKYNIKGDYVLLSFSDWYNNANYINGIACELKNNGLQPVALPMPEKLFSADIETIVDLPLSPIDWYALIVYSQGYIGERMHPIVTCLHNSIPFYSFDEYGVDGEGQKAYIPKSSKTYSIVSEAEFTENFFSYHDSTRTMPSPDEVVERIISFNRLKCQSFAKHKELEYEKGMMQVLTSLY